MTALWTNFLYCVVNHVLGHIVINWVAAQVSSGGKGEGSMGEEACLVS